MTGLLLGSRERSLSAVILRLERSATAFMCFRAARNRIPTLQPLRKDLAAVYLNGLSMVPTLLVIGDIPLPS